MLPHPSLTLFTTLGIDRRPVYAVYFRNTPDGAAPSPVGVGYTIPEASMEWAHLRERSLLSPTSTL